MSEGHFAHFTNEGPRNRPGRGELEGQEAGRHMDLVKKKGIRGGMRPTFADPRTDFVFKRIFGPEEHKDVLIPFLNDLLELEGDHRIVDVWPLPADQRPKVAELKLSIVDVKCRDARG